MISNRRRGGIPLLALCALCFATPTPAGAAERRVETVGSAPLGAEAPKRPPRELALTQAVETAVLRVARELLPPDFNPSGGSRGSDGTEDWLRSQLGDDLLVYASQFSILEDRGERPAVFHRGPGVDTEYVVLASVDVDLDALRDQLRALGVLQEGGGQTELRLVVEGLRSYEPLRLLKETLEDHRGVRSVTPVEFTPGRVVLSLRADRGAREIVTDLQSEAPEGLKVVPVEFGVGEATVLVEWRKPGAR